MRLATNIKGLLLLCAATLFSFSCGCGTEPVPSTSEATLTVNPASVNVTFEAQTVALSVNGQDMGKVGETGQVVEKVFTPSGEKKEADKKTK